MDKVRIEVRRDENFPFGYGELQPLTENSPEVFDAMINWSKANPNAAIYKHYITREYEKVGELGKYEFKAIDGWNSWTPNTDRCHYVTYCTIYYQNKI